MKLAILALCTVLPACAGTYVDVTGCGNLVVVDQTKTVTATPSIKADGNTVPFSALP